MPLAGTIQGIKGSIVEDPTTPLVLTSATVDWDNFPATQDGFNVGYDGIMCIQMQRDWTVAFPGYIIAYGTNPGGGARTFLAKTTDLTAGGTVRGVSRLDNASIAIGAPNPTVNTVGALANLIEGGFTWDRASTPCDAAYYASQSDGIFYYENDKPVTGTYPQWAPYGVPIDGAVIASEVVTWATPGHTAQVKVEAHWHVRVPTSGYVSPTQDVWLSWSVVSGSIDPTVTIALDIQTRFGQWLECKTRTAEFFSCSAGDILPGSGVDWTNDGHALYVQANGGYTNGGYAPENGDLAAIGATTPPGVSPGTTAFVPWEVPFAPTRIGIRQLSDSLGAGTLGFLPFITSVSGADGIANLDTALSWEVKLDSIPAGTKQISAPVTATTGPGITVPGGPTYTVTTKDGGTTVALSNGATTVGTSVPLPSGKINGPVTLRQVGPYLWVIYNGIVIIFYHLPTGDYAQLKLSTAYIGYWDSSTSIVTPPGDVTITYPPLGNFQYAIDCWVEEPPLNYFHGGALGMRGKLRRGRTLLITGGVGTLTMDPLQTEMDAADYCFRGGYDNVLDSTVANIVAAAGFYQFLTAL